MATKYNQLHSASSTRFSKSPMAEVEFSRMTANPKVFTTYNAGDIVPIYYAEVLPHDTFDISVDFVNRLASAVIKPTMGTMQLDIYAYFVPNRIVNDSWKNVQGENTSGVWSAPEVDLGPLLNGQNGAPIQIPVCSVADYYGFPTQAPIYAHFLHQMNDLKFRGYLDIYNNYFRDENYQPEIPFSKLNVYNGFLHPTGSWIDMDNIDDSDYVPDINLAQPTSGTFFAGAIKKALYGNGSPRLRTNFTVPSRQSYWSALDRPLVANKLHDAFTSVLPAPQKGATVYFGVGDSATVSIDTQAQIVPFASSLPLRAKFSNTMSGETNLLIGSTVGVNSDSGIVKGYNYTSEFGEGTNIKGTNLVAVADLSQATGISVNDLRTAIATQQVYEALARGGSRYIETLRSFFGIKADNPFSDIPTELGHIRRELDLYQVAQTSASVENSTAQGDLAAFGYTSSGGHLFTRTFLEHGYIHVLAVVRHKNVYSTYLAPDNFRRSTLDFYLPQLANIGEQPVRRSLLNPFGADEEDLTLGYQEAWWEYRYEPDRVSGEFRTGLQNGLDVWTYADPYDANFTVVNGDWLKSNSREVLDRTLAVTSSVANQFIGMFSFTVDKQRPMPTYSVPGLDTI